MIQYFSQMLKLPVAAFVFSMEMLVKTMQGLQKIAYQGIDLIADGPVQTSTDALDDKIGVTSDVTDGTVRESAETTQQTTQQIPQQEEKTMPDQDLHDDMLKLVRYKILFVKRDYEEVLLPDQEELVSENTDPSGYTAWKVAEFIQNLGTTAIPKKWLEKKYPRDVSKDPPSSPPKNGPTIDRLDEEDKKYLRVYYEVLARYPRERFRYEERQIEVLEQIRDKMKDP
jgi:hypothetical protein